MSNQAVVPFLTFEEFREGVNTWAHFLEAFISSPLFNKIYVFVQKKYETEKCYPPKNDIFNAFKLTNINNLKVVIVGQDPYHQPGQAMGLSFSVPKGCKVPPSLVNIYKAINQDPEIKDFKIPNHGDLTKWAKQGVFMLNDLLTVTESKPASHKNSGWDKFTDHVIRTISKEKEGIVFLLWGKPAQQKAKIIDSKKHKILESVHPSPLSAHGGFFTCGHFSKVNQFLREKGQTEIDWNLD